MASTWVKLNNSKNIGLIAGVVFRKVLITFVLMVSNISQSIMCTVYIDLYWQVRVCCEVPVHLFVYKFWESKMMILLPKIRKKTLAPRCIGSWKCSNILPQSCYFREFLFEVVRMIVNEGPKLAKIAITGMFDGFVTFRRKKFCFLCFTGTCTWHADFSW